MIKEPIFKDNTRALGLAIHMAGCLDYVLQDTGAVCKIPQQWF